MQCDARSACGARHAACTQAVLHARTCSFDAYSAENSGGEVRLLGPVEAETQVAGLFVHHIGQQHVCHASCRALVWQKGGSVKCDRNTCTSVVANGAQR